MRIGMNMSSGNLTLDFARLTGPSSSNVLESETLNAPINTYTSYEVTYSTLLFRVAQCIF